MSKHTKEGTEPQTEVVIWVDDVDKSFLFLEKSWPCLPLAGFTLFDYTLESACRAKADRILVLCGERSASTIEPLMKKWLRRVPNLSLHHSPLYRSLGDSMRDIFEKSLVNSDFLLMSVGSIISDSLEKVLGAHRQRTKKNKNALMTLIYGEPTKSNSNLIRTDLGISYKSDTKQLSSYGADVEMEESSNSATTIRCDLIDPQLAVCSLQILSIFADNHDFQTMHQVITEILVNEEISCFQIHVHLFPPTTYCASINNLASYFLINQKLINRWFDPVAPDLLAFSPDCGTPMYTCYRNMLYSPSGERSSDNSFQYTIIGDKFTIGAGTLIENSTIGSECRIGSNCKIMGSILWDNVTVGDNCQLKDCLILSQAQIGVGCEIDLRCIVGSKATLPANSILKMGTFFKNQNEPLCLPTASDLWVKLIPTTTSTYEQNGPHSAAEQQEAEGEFSSFRDEVYACIQKCHAEQLKCRDFMPEINSLKLSYNVSLRDLQQAAVESVLRLSIENCDENQNSLFTNFQKIFNQMMPLMQDYFKKPEAQKNLLVIIQDYCLGNSECQKILMNLLHHLYDREILSEEIILDWYAGLEGKANDILKPKVEKFVTWLQEAEEESDDDDDEN